MCQKTKNSLEGYLKASYPLIYVTSNEEDRVQRIVGAVCNQKLESGNALANLFVWAEGVGIKPGSDDVADKDIDFDKLENMSLPAFLKHANEKAEISVSALNEGVETPWDGACYLAKDLHYLFKNPNPMLYRLIRTFARHAELCGQAIIAIGPPVTMPPELQHEFVVVDCDLPDKADIIKSVTELGESFTDAGEAGGEKIATVMADEKAAQELADAASGMTEKEIIGSVSLSLVQSGDVDRSFIADQKVEAIRKSGFLEIWPTENIGSIGGLDEFKTYMRATERAFTQEARDFGCKEPKGVMAVGVPGTGKSLGARVLGELFKRPVIRFDVGSTKGSLVGQSESQMRQAIKTAEAAAPCILFVDEIEKAFSGAGGGQHDGGVSVGQFGTFISWMQDHTSPVYVYATANNVDSLPPEFLRKGRFDETFWFDLPNEQERSEIWAIHLEKVGREVDEKHCVEKLIAETDGYSGAEIEQVVHDALRDAFADGAPDIDYNYLSAVIKRTKPLSVTRKDDIESMRAHGEKHFRAASIKQTANTKGTAGVRRIKTGGSK